MPIYRNWDVLYYNPQAFYYQTNGIRYLSNILHSGFAVSYLNQTDDGNLFINKVPFINQYDNELFLNAFSDKDKKSISTLTVNIYNFTSNVRDFVINLLDATENKRIGYFGSAGINDKILAGDYAYQSHLIVFNLSGQPVDICNSPHIPMHRYVGTNQIEIVNTGTTYTTNTVPQDYLHELQIIFNLPTSLYEVNVYAISLDTPSPSPPQHYQVLFFKEGDTAWTDITTTPYNILTTSPTPLSIKYYFYFGVTIKATSGVKENIGLVFDIFYI